jgi:hypothetical protein
MYEILLGKSLDALAQCDKVIAEKIFTLELTNKRLAEGVSVTSSNKVGGIDQLVTQISELTKLKREIEVILKQGNSLDI